MFVDIACAQPVTKIKAENLSLNAPDEPANLASIQDAIRRELNTQGARPEQAHRIADKVIVDIQASMSKSS
jgi:hypothetical protein